MADSYDLSYIINHLGEDREQYFNAATPPIIQSTNFVFKTVDGLRQAIKNEFESSIYSRGCNPTVAILRKKMAALEGAEDALAMASGVAAISSAVISQLKAGDHVVCIQKPYSWTASLLEGILKRFGVETTFVDGSVQSYEKATKSNTKLYYLESPNSWTFETQDLKAIAALARKNKIVTVIDNSYATPIFQRPIELGIDLVIHSASKYIGGHSDVVAGILCGSRAMIQKIFALEYMTLGATLSPHDAWLLIRGLRTLPLRMEKVAKSTREIIAELSGLAQIEKILFPADLGAGLFSLQLKTNDKAKIEKFCNSLKRFLIACSWGGYESLAYPACVFEPQPAKTCPAGNLVRFAVGLEDSHLLAADIKNALHSLD